MSWQHLTLDERYQIQAMFRNNASQADIARALGRNPSTISRELKRNGGFTYPSQGYVVPVYLADKAAKKARARRIAKGEASRKIVGELETLVEQKLRLGWSPQHICGRLDLEMNITLAHETIYQHVLRDNAKPAEERKGLRYCLRFHGYKHHRFKKSRMAEKTRARKNWIEDRPEAANNRSQFGHWERDLLLGKRGDSALLTILDRKSRYLLVRHVSRVDTETVGGETIKALKPHRAISKSMTNDNGVEFQRETRLQEQLGIPIFFCQPSSPWQRGSIENANGLVRQYMPRRSDFGAMPSWAPLAIQHTLNFRPRKILGFRTPHEVFHKQKVALMKGPLLRFGLEISL
jgi:IS30 family transposase